VLRALFAKTTMPEPESEIVVDDPSAPAEDSPAVTTTRTVEVVVYLLLVALALLLGFDNWRSGMGWAKDGPQTGYLPFYLCVILAGAALYGLVVTFVRRAARPQPSSLATSFGGSCRCSFRPFCSAC
jgi:putative tricarboxylic transport membrane protein